MSAVVVSTPPPTVMNTIDSAVSRGSRSPSISWCVIALMASSRGECSRTATSSRMRTITLPNSAWAAPCSGRATRVRGHVVERVGDHAPVVFGEPEPLERDRAGTGTVSWWVNSHSPASMNWSMKCVVQC